MINGNQYFLTVPIRFLNRRNIIKDSDCGIWHVFAIGIPALVTVCLLIICFFPHLIISRFDNIPCSTPRYSTPLSLFHLDNLALVLATILIAGTAVFRVRRLVTFLKKGNPKTFIFLHDRDHIKLTRAIAAVEWVTNYGLPEVKIFNSQLPQCFTKGWLCPKIWISDTLAFEMNEDDLQVILAHEHCHVLRYDNLVSRILTFISDLSWAYPWCRTILRDWYKRRELFCDNFSAQVVASRQKVASTLIKLAEVIMLRKEFHTIIPGTAFYYEDKPLIQTRVENLLFPICRRDAKPCVSAYRYKLWFFALFGLCMFIFVVMVSIILAGSLTYMHCLMEDIFSLYCSAC